jgi:hypothetical protein
MRRILRRQPTRAFLASVNIMVIVGETQFEEFNPLLSLSAENNPGCLEHKTFVKNLDFRHSVRK